ncbi:MAG: citrate (Si)-synthase [Desulfococcus sp. 4484_241]|nr:MAG: citrate (Si)-synthase [Desulfococcus sp. 4484_241]
MAETVTIIIDGEKYEFPVITGSEGEKAIDIRQLRAKTGYITYDPGFGNSGSCKSAITYMDGKKGVLRYRGYPIEDLAENCCFVEVCYLLLNGDLPNRSEYQRVSVMLNDHSLVHEDMQIFFQNFPRSSNPMGILSSMVNALRSFYPELMTTEEAMEITFMRLISKVRTMAAMSHRISRGHKIVYPRPDYSYCANFLNMMFDSPVRPYEIKKEFVDALNMFWVLHADHEQNCSTSTVRGVGSARANIYAALSAGIAALWGPLHGGANRAVVEMLEDIRKNGGDVKKAVERAKDKNDPFRLMGFGHSVYKTYDPRAKIMKKMCDKVLAVANTQDPLLDIAMQLEEVALNDDYFKDHNLYPNIDFYSGIVLRALGIPVEMFTVMFALGRLPGWIAHWRELMDDPEKKLFRPRQVYVGETERRVIPIDER